MTCWPLSFTVRLKAVLVLITFCGFSCIASLRSLREQLGQNAKEGKYLEAIENHLSTKWPPHKQESVSDGWKIVFHLQKRDDRLGQSRRCWGQSLNYIFFFTSLCFAGAHWGNTEHIHMLSWPFLYIMTLSWIQHETVRYDSAGRVHCCAALMLPMEPWLKAASGSPLNIFSLAFYAHCRRTFSHPQTVSAASNKGCSS